MLKVRNMAHPAGKKEESRAKILASAGQGFRRHGFGGLGIDALAKEAGVTSGAFYAHFKSKAEAFRAAVSRGMAELADGVDHFRREGGGWVARFVEFYLIERRTCDLGESCALQSLTNEVARAEPQTRMAYEAELRRTIEGLASGMVTGSTQGDRAKAIALLATLSGGISMARAVNDPALADEIISALRSAAEV
jgi:AcrR family transcriptional regulator